MNQHASFEKAKTMLEEIAAAAKAGDSYAQKLHRAYAECSPTALMMPWPEKKHVD